MILSKSKNLEYLGDCFYFSMPGLTSVRIKDEELEEEWNKLAVYYKELETNAYHNTSHIVDIARKIDALEHNKMTAIEGKIDIDCFLVAALYHDCIYKANKRDNEEKSKEVMRCTLRRFGVDDSKIRYIGNLIQPENPYMSFEYNIFRDLDYSILGEHEIAYEAYRSGIETEYVTYYPYQVYLDARLRFLRDIVSPLVYKSNVLGIIFEHRAKENILDEMEEIGTQQRLGDENKW